MTTPSPSKRVQFSTSLSSELSRFTAIHQRRSTGAQRRRLEVCVDSLHSARNAIAGGADRLELCSSLAQGGLTPSVGLLLAVHAHINTLTADVRVFCMLRSRAGDFEYSDDEMSVMLHDVDQLRMAGAHGFVFGALQFDGSVDVTNCTRVKHAAQGLPLTFHRAFDTCTDWRTSLTTIGEMGYERVLTSGQSSKAVDAIDTIADMVVASADTPLIMVGSGVSMENIARLVSETHACEFHASASIRETKTSISNVKIGTADDDVRIVTQRNIVETLATCVHRDEF